MQSHVIRAPIARLMSLVQLLQMEDYESEIDRKNLESYIAEAAEQLDNVISEIVSKAADIQSELDASA